MGSIKSLNCVSIVNILSRQNILKLTTLKTLFDDVIVTSLHLLAISYNQKIEHAKMSNCSKFHQIQIKSTKAMEEGGIHPPPDPFGLRDVKKASTG